MKRESVAQLELVEKRELKIKRIQDISHNLFVVPEGPNHGFYKNFEDIKRFGGHKKGYIYKNFARSADAVQWYRHATNLPRYTNPNMVIYLSAACYDVIAYMEFFASVCCMSSNMGSFCKQANPTKDSMTLSFALLRHVLQTIPPHLEKVQLVIDCPRLAYGLKYGLWAYPKKDILSPPNKESEEMYQRIQQQKIEVAHCIQGNPARKLVEKMCSDQYHNVVLPFYKSVIRDRRLAWIQCGLRLRLPKDLIRLIAQYMQRQSCINDAPLF